MTTTSIHRSPGTSAIVDPHGIGLRVVVEAINGDSVRLRFEAPGGVEVMKEETLRAVADVDLGGDGDGENVGS